MFESPWYDLSGWLGVKSQLSICLSVYLSIYLSIYLQPTTLELECDFQCTERPRRAWCVQTAPLAAKQPRGRWCAWKWKIPVCLIGWLVVPLVAPTSVPMAPIWAKRSISILTKSVCRMFRSLYDRQRGRQNWWVSCACKDRKCVTTRAIEGDRRMPPSWNSASTLLFLKSAVKV